MSHLCHAINCEKEVLPKMFMCSRHWYSLHKHFRTLVWRYYEPGQENTKRVSLEYILVTMFSKMYVKWSDDHSSITDADIAYMREQIRKHREKGTSPDLIKYCIDLFDTSTYCTTGNGV
jgi:hypothetical protein